MRKQEEFDRLKKELIAYRCAACGYIVLSLANLKALENHPKRRADGSHAVVENTFVRLLKVTDAGTAYVRRVAGEGSAGANADLFERQERLSCCSCGTWVAYRSLRSKYLYILSGALQRNQNGGVWARAGSRNGSRSSGVTAAAAAAAPAPAGDATDPTEAGGYGQMDDDEDENEGGYRP